MTTHKIIILLVTAAITLISGIVFMALEYFSDGALFIILATLLAAIANTEYKQETLHHKRLSYLTYTLGAAFASFILLPEYSDAQVAPVLLLTLYVAVGLYTLIQTIRAFRND